MLFADDAFAESPRKSEPPRDGFLPDGANYTAAEGWSISSRFGGDSPACDSSGNPSDSAGGDSGGGADGGGGDGGGGGD